MNALRRAKALMGPIAVIAPGMFGAGNIGDEAMLQGFATLVAGYLDRVGFWCAARNPAHLARVVPGFHYYRERGLDAWGMAARALAKWFLVVGDTPIMDHMGPRLLERLCAIARSARRQGKPLAFLGVGTEELRGRDSIALFRAHLADSVAMWTVRSDRDIDRLTSYGVREERICVTADLAWLVAPCQPGFAEQYLRDAGVDPHRSPLVVGVNVTRDPSPPVDIFGHIALCLDRLIETHDALVLFLANEVRPAPKFDNASSRAVMERMKLGRRAFVVPNEYWTPQQMLSFIACCDLTIGLRYHYCLFSALSRVPFFAVQRLGKVRDLCTDLGWEYGVRIDQLTAEALFEAMSEMIVSRASLADRLAVRATELRRRALDNAMALNRLFGSS